MVAVFSKIMTTSASKIMICDVSIIMKTGLEVLWQLVSVV